MPDDEHEAEDIAGEDAGKESAIFSDVLGIGEVSKGTVQLIDKYFGGVIKDAVGYGLGDWLSMKRAESAIRNENTLKVFQKAAEKLADKGDIDKLKKLKLKTASTLIENASLEEDESLQELWAQMLANAMDPNAKLDITRVHVSLLKELELIDVRILYSVYQEQMVSHPNRQLSEIRYSKAALAKNLGMPDATVELSLLNLMRLGCIKPGVIEAQGARIGNMPMTIYEGTTNFHLSELGVALCQSVSNAEPAPATPAPAAPAS